MKLPQKLMIELLQNFITATSNAKSEAKRGKSTKQLSSKRKRPEESPAVTDVISTEGKGGSAHELASSPNSKSSKTNHDSLSAMKAFVGRRVAKYFHKEMFPGTVKKVIRDDEAECGFYFHVKYDDGDSEDFDKSELMDGITL